MKGNNPSKDYPTIACCGLDCGLCPTFYTKGSSKCPGCCGPNFASKHPSCSIITCCVKNNNFETCAECAEFPCSKLKNWDKYDSFICHRVSLTNLNFIKEKGLELFLTQQKKRIELLEYMLKNYNEGKSKSFFCIATALLPINSLKKALKESNQRIENEDINAKVLKTKSKILKNSLIKLAAKNDMELKLRRK